MDLCSAQLKRVDSQGSDSARVTLASAKLDRVDSVPSFDLFECAIRAIFSFLCRRVCDMIAAVVRMQYKPQLVS